MTMGNYMGLCMFRINVIMKMSNRAASVLLFDLPATARAHFPFLSLTLGPSPFSPDLAPENPAS